MFAVAVVAGLTGAAVAVDRAGRSPARSRLGSSSASGRQLDPPGVGHDRARARRRSRTLARRRGRRGRADLRGRGRRPKRAGIGGGPAGRRRPADLRDARARRRTQAKVGAGRRPPVDGDGRRRATPPPASRWSASPPTGSTPARALDRRARSPATRPSTVAGRRRPGAEPSVSSGVVSSLDRTVARRRTSTLLRADRDRQPVPPTADGGALVGPDGAVVGHQPAPVPGRRPRWATPCRSTSPGRSAIDLLEHGRARRAWLGVDG